MKIIIAGGSGFLGKALRRYFEGKNNEVYILGRKARAASEILWDGRTSGAWADRMEGADVLINLSGKSVDCRYTSKNKKAILDSRILSTRILQAAVDGCKHPPGLWINASSATIYIHAVDQVMDEFRGVIGDDFSMNVCKAWEAAFFEKPVPGLRKVAIRSSIVLGNEGGAFPINCGS